MMTSKEVVKKTVAFERPDRLARVFPEKFGNDFAGLGMTPSPDDRPNSKKERSEERRVGKECRSRWSPYH